MSEQPSSRTEAEDGSRLDDLLGLLGDLSKRDPSPALRERLRILAFERLNQNARQSGQRPRTGWKLAFAATCLIVAGLATELAVHFFRFEPVQNAGTAQTSPPANSPEARAHSVPAARSSAATPPEARHFHSPVLVPIGPRQMTMRLPYSNNAIETGTATTIRVSMSQSDLLSLGFPINRTVEDRRIVANLTLGDDGLPRAISVPLPLEVMKERR